MSKRYKYKVGDIVRATDTFSDYYFFRGNEYKVTGIVKGNYTVMLHVHSDTKLEVSTDHLVFVRHHCMFGEET